MAKLVRLKPFNPRRGYFMRSYTLQGIRIREEDGWHEVDDDLAEKFAQIHATPDNPDSPLGFDVMDQSDALKYEAEQKRLAQQKATADEPIKVRRVRPVDDRSPAAADTRYGRPPPTSANRARTHHPRPDETSESRNIAAITDGAVPGAPRTGEEEGGEEYDLAIADLGSQATTQQGVRAAQQAPFLDGSQMSIRVGDPDKRNPDPRNLGERRLGAYDDTPFVDGSRDAVLPPQDTPHGADPRNPDPRNTGSRAAGAYDDTPFVDGSRDAVVPPFTPPKTIEDEAQMQPVDGRTLPRVGAPGASIGSHADVENPAAVDLPPPESRTADPRAQVPGAPRGNKQQPQRTRTRG